ncbi:MAG: AMP-binding protein [Thermogemmata sp.]|nr:AMP-binding protein [Thermogemmata sp.]
MSGTVLLWLVGTVAAAAAVTWLFPGLLRPAGWVLCRLMYRWQVVGRERIPAQGGVLLIANHVSYIDWLLLWVACPRPVRFVLWSRYYRHPLLRFVLSWGRHWTIRIDDEVQRPHTLDACLQKIAAALQLGQVVVMFPEGKLSRCVAMRRFGRGIERILRLAPQAVVVPAGIYGLWGSWWAESGGRAFRKWPRWRPRVWIGFGMPLPPDRSAADYRQAVQEVLSDLAIADSSWLRPLPVLFVRQAARWRLLLRPCIVDYAAGNRRVLSWGKTYAAACCVADYLRARVGTEPHIGVWLPTGLGSALANLAIALLRRGVVNLNYTAGTAAVHSAIRQAGLRWIITARRFLERCPLTVPEGVNLILLEEILESVTTRQRLRHFLAALLLPGWLLERRHQLHRLRPDDLLTIVFSSGSTGEPKGVMLTHRNVGSNVLSAIQTIEIQRSDRLCGVLPFFHSFGYTVCLWAPLAAGCRAIYYPDPRAAKDVGDIVRQEKATILLSTATFLRFYLRRCEADAFRTLRILIAGAEKLPVSLQKEFEDKFGVRPLEGYGCTELSPVVSTNLHDLIVDDDIQVRNRPGTVGQPILGVAVRACTPDDQRLPLPVGHEGVLCVKGPNVMAGYLHQPQKTAEAIRDGWYCTGDIGCVEPDGFVRITGRLSRFAKIGGEMVPLERLDEELHDILQARGERYLAVAAVPDSRRGERIVVLYLSSIAERLDATLAALAQRGLPPLWIPDRRDCYPVDSMPVLGSGKLDLKRLTEVAVELACCR